jgi:hypothetical protein
MTVTEFWCFLATVIINMVIIGLPNMKDYWSHEWSYHVPFFNYIFSRDRFLQIFWMLQLSPKPPTTGPLTKTKTMLYRLKVIDANKKPTTNLQFRRKLVEELSADRMAVRGSKSGIVRSQMMGPKDLVANSILYMLMRQQFQRLQCVLIVK